MAKLGVNIDHVATLREARRSCEPSPLDAARECVSGGCDSIVCHLREDRRHIKDTDVVLLRELVDVRLNLEMSIAREIVAFACKIGPDQATLVPERRQEITTEGGLDVVRYEDAVSKVVSKLTSRGIDASLFIDPSKRQIDASVRCGAGIVELHTGEYADSRGATQRKRRLAVLRRAVSYARSKGLEVNAGHGLNYDNAKDVATIEGIHELNIGHSIVSRAVFTGMRKAVEDMAELIR